MFSSPLEPKAPSSLHPHENTTPFELNARECIPPQANFIIWLAGKFGPREKRGILMGFFTCNTSSPKPKVQLIIYETQKKIDKNIGYKNSSTKTTTNF